MGLHPQNHKITKSYNILTLSFTTILFLLKLTLNLVTYSTRSHGSSIIGLTIPLGATSSCDLEGESLTFSIKTSRTFAFFSLALESIWLSDRGQLPNVSSTHVPTSFIVLHESISISSPTSQASFICATKVGLVGNATIVSWKFGITKCGIDFW